MLRINYNPRLTMEVARRGLLDADPLRVIDCGARGGASPIWDYFGAGVRILPVEADATEAAKLGVEPTILGARREHRTFYRTPHAGSEGLYPFDELLAGTVSELEVAPNGTIEVETVTLDSLDHPRADVLKLDVQGAEYDVLQGATRAVASALAIELEIHFAAKPTGSAPFAEVDTFLRRAGFELYDLDVFRYARRCLPSPELYDYRDAAGRPISGPTVEGQVMTGDAIYFRPDQDRTLKLACLLELHRLSDCACQLLRGSEYEDLLDFLAPPVDGAEARYDSYMEHARRFMSDEGRIFGPNYHQLVDLWALHGPSG